MTTKLHIITIIAASLIVSSSYRASAQSDAQRRQAAAEAYDRGTAAYLAGNYLQAAQWFETANRMAPAAAALMQAIRAHRRAGNDLRAATLALQITDKYPNEPAVTQYGEQVLSELRNRFLHVEVSCGGCTLDLDGTLQEYLAFFAEPGTSHTIIAHFESGDVKQEVSGAAGEKRTLTLEPSMSELGPGVGAQNTGANAADSGAAGDQEAEKGGKKGLSPVYTYVGGGLTVALAVGIVVSGVSAVSSRKEFDKDHPKGCAEGDTKCEKEWNNGAAKQTLANVFIGLTAAAGVATGVIAIFFTDWSSGDSKSKDVTADVTLLPGGGAFSVKTQF